MSTVSSKNPSSFVVSDVRTSPDSPRPSGFQVQWRINPHMQPGATSLDVAEAEHRAFVQALEKLGAKIWRAPFLPGAYDSVFMKDSAVVMRDENGGRAFLTRPPTLERRREPESRARLLERYGFTICGQSKEFLEGGDVVVAASKQLALMGYGFRTSKTAAKDLAQFLGFEVMPIELRDPYFYHLDTAMNLTMVGDDCVAFAYPEAFTAASWKRLNEHPLITRIVSVDREEAMHFALNWVEVQDHVIMGALALKTAAALETLGKRVQVSPLSQFQLAGGSAACLVAPVHNISRSMSHESSVRAAH